VPLNKGMVSDKGILQRHGLKGRAGLRFDMQHLSSCPPPLCAILIALAYAAAVRAERLRPQKETPWETKPVLSD
jgi:hypothetical protein